MIKFAKRVLSVLMVVLIMATVSTTAFAADVNTTAKALQFNKDGKFRIMHVTDTHLDVDNCEASVWLIAQACDREKPDIVILDPPRKGSDEITLGAIISAKPKRIVYVSCNPATLARDLRFLCDNGYNVKKVYGADLFPQTVHCEVISVIER